MAGVTGILLGVLVVSPVGAHFIENTRHLGVHAWSDFIRDRVYTRAQTEARFYRRGVLDVRNDQATCAINRAAPGRHQSRLCHPFLVDGHTTSVGIGADVAIGTDGNPTISYHDANADALEVVHCNDPLCSGNDEAPVDVEFFGLGGSTSIVIGTDGNPTIAFSNPVANDLRVLHCNDPSCAGGDDASVQVDNTATTTGKFASVAIAPDGNPVVSYSDQTNGLLRVVHCNDPSCAGGNDPLETVDAGDVGQHTSIAIAPDGNPVVSYYDFGNGNLKVVHCNDPNCAGGDETPQTVDDDTNVGQYTSIAIGTDGNPTVAYLDVDRRDLRVVHCNDPDCAGGDEVPQVVDSFGVVGEHASLALGADGNPVISYYDATNGDLKVVHCNDPACASPEFPVIADATDDVGRGTSITIAPGGHAVIAYRNFTNNDLKLTTSVG